MQLLLISTCHEGTRQQAIADAKKAKEAPKSSGLLANMFGSAPKKDALAIS